MLCSNPIVASLLVIVAAESFVSEISSTWWYAWLWVALAVDGEVLVHECWFLSLVFFMQQITLVDLLKPVWFTGV